MQLTSLVTIETRMSGVQLTFHIFGLLGMLGLGRIHWEVRGFAMLTLQGYLLAERLPESEVTHFGKGKICCTEHH